MDIARALGATEGICCFVGAGGKKTTMYALAHRVDRAVVTATVRIPLFDDHVADLVLTEDPHTAIEAASQWPLGVVPAREGQDRYGGYDPEVFDPLDDSRAGVILVKADGARMRRFKAPGDAEPQVPHNATTVVPVVSAHVVGEPLDARRVHRPERVREITGLSLGDPITADVVGQVIACEDGGQKGVPGGATVVPLVNMVDTPADERTGRAIAESIHRHADLPYVVLASMRAESPLVDIV